MIMARFDAKTGKMTTGLCEPCEPSFTLPDASARKIPVIFKIKEPEPKEPPKPVIFKIKHRNPKDTL